MIQIHKVTHSSLLQMVKMLILSHVTFEFHLINLNNISISVMCKNADSVTRGLCVISFPLHPHRGAGSQTSARRQAFIWFRQLPPSHEPPLLMKCPSMECLHYYTADRDWCFPKPSAHATILNLNELNCRGGQKQKKETFKSWKIQGVIVLTFDVLVWGEKN